jgi:hypothetical protein
VDLGAVVLWPNSSHGLAVFLGQNHAERAERLVASLSDMVTATAAGSIDLEHMWPAGVRARGMPIDAALAEIARAAGER